MGPGGEEGEEEEEDASRRCHLAASLPGTPLPPAPAPAQAGKRLQHEDSHLRAGSCAKAGSGSIFSPPPQDSLLPKC